MLATVYVWNSEENLLESVLFFHPVGLGIELWSSSLAASTFTNRAISPM